MTPTPPRDPMRDFTRQLFGKDGTERESEPEPTTGPRAPRQKARPSTTDVLAYGKPGDMNDYARRLFGRD